MMNSIPALERGFSPMGELFRFHFSKILLLLIRHHPQSTLWMVGFPKLLSLFFRRRTLVVGQRFGKAQ